MVIWYKGREYELVEQHGESVWFAYPLHKGQRIFENVFEKGLFANKKLRYKEAILIQVNHDHIRTDSAGKNQA